eukprot:Skav219158  [mRNA]  locus=scaffold121:24848:30028:- [translate_table: standard]
MLRVGVSGACLVWLLLNISDTDLLHVLRHHELHRPLQLRVCTKMVPGRSFEISDLHLQLPLAASQQIQVQLLPLLPYLGLHWRLTCGECLTVVAGCFLHEERSAALALTEHRVASVVDA